MNSQRTVNSASLFSRAQRVMPGGNSRTTVYSSPYPLYAASGIGSRVTDVDGVVRLDAINNFTALIHGHAQPDVLAAAQEQIKTGICFGMPTKSEIDLAELLCDRLRSAERVRFTNSGTEAVMAAIKAARAFTRRSKIAKCEGAYHGAYDVAEVSQTAAPSNWGDLSHPRSVPVSFATPARVLDDVIVLPFNRVEESESLLRKYGPEIAGILIDPLPNRAGLISASPEFLAMIRRVATDRQSARL
jgi:glutamate-1-semialdehyde 2,1-aminomutase